MTVLLTGSSGFVGRHLCQYLRERSIPVRPAARAGASAGGAIVVGEIGPDTDWSMALQGIETIVHAAGRAHMLRDRAVDPLAEYRAVNVAGTVRLASQAASVGVKKFVYLSSIKVNGNRTSLDRGFSAEDRPAAEDPYGQSKMEAEQSLLELAKGTSIDVAIVRPPLVYGPGVRANFLRMLRAVHHRVPLPLASVHNRRSMVSVWNLCDFLTRLIGGEAPANRIWMVSDDEDLSTPELLRRIGTALGVSPRLFPCPPGLIRLAGTLLGRGEEAARVCESLRVDIDDTKSLLGWRPPVSVDEGLRRTAEWYLEPKQ